MGLIETMRETPGSDDVARLAQALHLELDDLLPLVDAAELLGLARVDKGEYDLTDAGQQIADAEEKARKAIFRQCAGRIPLLQTILAALGASENGQVPREQILAAIPRRFSRKSAERQLDTAVEWGRYAELFDYDAEARHFVKA
ncbi:MAG TPA: AAA-associated domain-containing protein [Vicinamibacterales bacterium]|nr:AAA-associated domain-containing protein [Vicinamibacterales bacterium]